MYNKSEVKSATGISENPQKKSARSDNLYASPSFVGKFRKFTERKQKSQFSKSSSNSEPPVKNKLSNDRRLTSNLPKDAAAHFGNFYGIQASANKPQPGRVKSFLESTASSYKTTPRLEFTRQMVQKLERTAGTAEYARQVSALLEETVEPAHFKLHSLPAENSIPDGRYNPTGFPLWYKEPYKMPFRADELYKLLKEKFDNVDKRAKEIFDEDSSEKNSWEDLSEYDQEEQDEECEHLLGKEKPSFNSSLNESSSTTEAKDTDSKESNEPISDKS
ncbi:hypothetical protein WH47_06308 [Habropoda laboriosa]|uniref:Uncharacterized protein n=1 Tax=Habropoda laboriosa TaxID=597456 RepID=A0A0L7RC08_9HYME|nr:PREDICTED: uncharacterized protein LOC108579448 [Habropoda laboriosa]KOC68517.1 hypothetical protein WH47_06308 [Habropoda laboriosa]